MHARNLALLVTTLLFFIPSCFSDGYTENPILQHQPEFARSLPVQILMNGIVLALASVLLMHLLFTTQYHWTLAPVNYSLQLAGILSLLISLIATLAVVLAGSFEDTQVWPYMIKYLARDVPPTSTYSNTTSDEPFESSQWTTAALAAWYAMDATTSGLVQITHIQFLTLLYPSKLERRLILGLLGPLAVLSAAMELVPINQSQPVVDIADTIRNTCNATLSLLFSAALFLWGLFVNRKQAWRTDGGTATFGTAALILTTLSTALTFYYIPARNQYLWLPSLIWTVVLWQSFLGWWWWVGGGRGVGEIEELLQREERIYRKRQARAMRRTVRKEKAQALWRSASETLGLVRRSNGTVVPATEEDPDRDITSSDGSEPRPNEGQAPSSSSLSTQPERFSRLRSTRPIVMLTQFYHLLRLEHLAAAHSQALDWMRRRRMAFGADDMDRGPQGRAGVGIWGSRAAGSRRSQQADTFEMQTVVSERMPEKVGRQSIWWTGPFRQWRLQDRTAYE